MIQVSRKGDQVTVRVMNQIVWIGTISEFSLALARVRME